MNMKFKQHIPDMVSGVEPHEEDFNSLEELLNIDIVKRFKSKETFYQYSLSDGCRLMAEYDDGYRWWVIGFVEGLVEGLPNWVPKYDKEKEEKELNEHYERINKEYTEKNKQRVKTYLEELDSSLFDILKKFSGND